MRAFDKNSACSRYLSDIFASSSNKKKNKSGIFTGTRSKDNAFETAINELKRNSLKIVVNNSLGNHRDLKKL